MKFSSTTCLNNSKQPTYLFLLTSWKLSWNHIPFFYCKFDLGGCWFKYFIRLCLGACGVERNAYFKVICGQQWMACILIQKLCTWTRVVATKQFGLMWKDDDCGQPLIPKGKPPTFQIRPLSFHVLIGCYKNKDTTIEDAHNAKKKKGFVAV